MKHKQLFLSLLVAGTAVCAGVRGWSLLSAIDLQGLPIPAHPATFCLVALTVIFTLLFLFFSTKSPGRAVTHRVLVFSKGQSILSLISAFLFLLGVSLSLMQSQSTASLVLFFLGWMSGICLARLAKLRQTGNRSPLPELVPVVYFIVKLVLNFKNWSTDPIILDYFDPLFALIFTMFAFYGSAGFAFDRGQPRKTLFYSAAAILFCAMAAVSGILSGDYSSAVAYTAYLLWLIPVMQCLLTPHPAPEKTA